MGLITTNLTTEFQTMPVIPAYVVASRASLRGVSWINIDYSDSSFLGLVLDEGLELPESPARMLIPELFRYFVFSPFPDSSEIFHTDCGNIVFSGKFYEILGYPVIYSGHEPCLST